MEDKKLKLYSKIWVGLFFILLIIVLFHSFGYKVDLKTGETIQAGGMVIKTTLKNVSLYKNGEFIRQNNFIDDLITDFIKIENIPPNSYDFEVRKENYQTWKKRVLIKPGQVEKFEHIVLLKDNYTPQIIIPELSFLNTENSHLWHLPTHQQLFYTDKNGLHLLTPNNSTPQLLLEKKTLQSIGNIIDILPSTTKETVILKTDHKQKNLYIYNLTNQKTYSLEDIFFKIQIQSNTQNPITPTDLYAIMQQNQINNSHIFFLSQQNLYTIKYTTTPEVHLIASNVINFYIHNQSLYFTQNTTPNTTKEILYRTSIDSLNPKSITNNKIVELSPDLYQQPFKIIESNNKSLLLSNNNAYLITNTSLTQICHNITDGMFLQNNKALVLFNEHEVWIYYIEKRTYQPYREQGDKELITRFSGKLQNVYIYKDEEHLIYQEDKTLKFTELDNRGHRNTQTLYNLTTPDTPLFYQKNNNTIYFFNDNQQFAKIALDAE